MRGVACEIQSVATAVTSVTYKRTTARYVVTELRLCHMLSVNNKAPRDTKCVHMSRPGASRGWSSTKLYPDKHGRGVLRILGPLG